MNSKDIFNDYFKHILLLSIITWIVNFLIKTVILKYYNAIFYVIVFLIIIPFIYGFFFLNNHNYKKILIIIIGYFALTLIVTMVLQPVSSNLASNNSPMLDLVESFRINQYGVLKAYFCLEDMLKPYEEGSELNPFCVTNEYTMALYIIASFIIFYSITISGSMFSRKYYHKNMKPKQ